MDTILALTEKLQRAEERALAAELISERRRQALADLENDDLSIPDRIWEECLVAKLLTGTAAREVMQRAELFDQIENAFPTTYACRHGEVTGVSVLDDVKDLIHNKAKAEGLGEHCRQLRLALADALQIVFASLPPKPHDGPCGGPDAQCDQACVDFANAASEYGRLFRVKNAPPHHFEEAAREVLRKAEECDTLDGYIDRIVSACNVDVTVNGHTFPPAMVVDACIAEVERLRQESADFESVCMSQEGQIARLMAELATAKKIGAAECAEVLERHAAQYTSDDETSVALSGMLIKIAAELRAEVGE
jgi:hypothetical protein